MTDISSKVVRNVAVLNENKTVLDAAKIMVERYIGSIVVDGAHTVKGIFTERDLMRIVAQQQNIAQTPLKDVMRADIIRVTPNHTIEDCLALMRAHRCRHLLVFESETFVGIVSLRDLAALMLEEKEILVEQLTKYITTG